MWLFKVMEEEDSSGVGWPHDLLLMRDKARASLQQLQAADVYAAWMDNVQAAVNTTMPWPDMPKRASFGFSGSAHSLAAAGKSPKPQSPNPQPPNPTPKPTTPIPQSQPPTSLPHHRHISHPNRARQRRRGRLECRCDALPCLTLLCERVSV